MKVFIIAALTADGFIGKDANHLADWTAKEDKELFVKLTKEAGVIVMGSKTFDTIGRALPGRRMFVYTSEADKYEGMGIETTDVSPDELAMNLETEGVKGLAVCGGTSVYDQFLHSGIVDELYLTIAPKLFGAGVKLFTNKVDKDLSLLGVEKLNENTILLHYSVKNNEQFCNPKNSK